MGKCKILHIKQYGNIDVAAPFLRTSWPVNHGNPTCHPSKPPARPIYGLSLFTVGSSCLRTISMLISFLHRSTQQEDQHCCYHTHHPQSQHRKTMYNMGVMLTRPNICNQNQFHAKLEKNINIRHCFFNA